LDDLGHLLARDGPQSIIREMFNINSSCSSGGRAAVAQLDFEVFNQHILNRLRCFIGYPPSTAVLLLVL
jgi:hypothetical protein